MSFLLAVLVLVYLTCMTIKMFVYDAMSEAEWKEIALKDIARLMWEYLFAPYYLAKPLVQTWWRWWITDAQDGSHDAL